MNDSALAHNIGKMLVEIAQRMSAAQGTELMDIGEDLLFAESDFSGAAA
jgi:methanogenic corrinoid protein MtbC1